MKFEEGGCGTDGDTSAKRFHRSSLLEVESFLAAAALDGAAATGTLILFCRLGIGCCTLDEMDTAVTLMPASVTAAGGVGTTAAAGAYAGEAGMTTEALLTADWVTEAALLMTACETGADW